MSKLFFDHLLDFKDLDKRIKEVSSSVEEREEMRAIVDGIIHHKVLSAVLCELPLESHHEFLEIIEKYPHDTIVVFEYLRVRIGPDIENKIRSELEVVKTEIMSSFS